MSLLTPVWLLLLVPWLGLVVLSLRGFRPKILVPYLELWPRDELSPENRRNWRPPSLPVLLLLLAILAVILALSGPLLRSSQPQLRQLTVIMDRGITMLAGNRLAHASTRLREALDPLLAADATIRVVDDAGNVRLVGIREFDAQLAQPARAILTHDRLNDLITRELRDTNQPVILLSDWPPAEKNPRFLSVSPTGNIQNIGIVGATFAAGKLQVEIRNDSTNTTCPISLQSASSSLQDTLKLPPQGKTQSFTFTLAGSLPVIIHLDIPDDFQEDNHWKIPPPFASPRISTTATVSPALQRFISAYLQTRPPTADARTISVGTESSPHAVTLHPCSDPITIAPGVRVTGDHPLLQNVHLPTSLLATLNDLPDGYHILWQIGKRPLLAIDESKRNIWIGFASTAWEDEPDFVIFWTNIIQWLDADSPPPMAGNIPAPQFPPAMPQQDISAKLLALASRENQLRLAPWGFALAAAFFASALCVWGLRR